LPKIKGERKAGPPQEKKGYLPRTGVPESGKEMRLSAKGTSMSLGGRRKRSAPERKGSQTNQWRPYSKKEKGGDFISVRIREPTKVTQDRVTREARCLQWDQKKRIGRTKNDGSRGEKGGRRILGGE